MVEQQAIGRLATVRLILSRARHAPVVDLLFALSALGVTNSYLQNKRINAVMMRDKG